MEDTQKTTNRRYGFHRWLIVALIVINVLAVRFISPITPHIQIPPEHVLQIAENFHITNTMIAAWLAELILIVMAFLVYRATRGGAMMLNGLPGLLEIVLEAIYDLAESTAGKHARKVFPWVATIILVVLMANWLELIPGVDSIGWLHEVHGDAKGYPAREILPGVSTIVQDGGEAAEHEGEHLYQIIPFVRVASTDLNFTAGIALISVIMTQVIGVQVLGTKYFNKFFQFGGVFKIWFKDQLGPFDLIMPFLDVFVGLLELIAEFAKVLSFSFRLFGNIFAGSVLLFVIGSLVPVFVQSGFLLFELFVGAIQALVFGMLTMVFMTMATQSHEEH